MSELDGLLAEYDGAPALLEAARSAYAAGYRRLDAFSPFPVEGLAEAIGFERTRLPGVVLAGGVFGGAAGYLLQRYSSVSAYPLNVGGRPYHSWPAFIPVTFELAILCASLAAVLGMLALNGLPRPHHPLFNVDRFALATRDRFFLYIESGDALFEAGRTRRLLESTRARGVHDVPH
ncbi:MAG: DUF3341 domain-containing protein [Elusimicrobia bacterium]|nr:DUF3341 domain-containing protein [Elusimicrobiota bacterium]